MDDNLYGGCTRRKSTDSCAAANFGSVVLGGRLKCRRTELGDPSYHPQTSPPAHRDPPRLGQVEPPRRQAGVGRRHELDVEDRRRKAADGDTAQSARPSVDVDDVRPEGGRRPRGLGVEQRSADVILVGDQQYIYIRCT